MNGMYDLEFFCVWLLIIWNWLDFFKMTFLIDVDLDILTANRFLTLRNDDKYNNSEICGVL